MLELAIHEFAIDEPCISEIRARKRAVGEAAVDKVAPRKQAPIPIDLAE
jgi:hypothetical protein